MKPERREDPFERPEIQWGVGCLAGLTAVTGVLILVLLVAIALQPPTWVQVVLGIALTAGGAVFGWLVASAFAQSRLPEAEQRSRPGPSAGDEDPDRRSGEERRTQDR